MVFLLGCSCLLQRAVISEIDITSPEINGSFLTRPPSFVFSFQFYAGRRYVFGLQELGASSNREAWSAALIKHLQPLPKEGPLTAAGVVGAAAAAPAKDDKKDADAKKDSWLKLAEKPKVRSNNHID